MEKRRKKRNVKNKRPIFKQQFIRENPGSFALLNVLRKALITDKDFNIILVNQFSLNEKEYGIWGRIASDYHFITIHRTKNQRWKCKILNSTLLLLESSIKNLEVKYVTRGGSSEDSKD